MMNPGHYYMARAGQTLSGSDLKLLAVPALLTMALSACSALSAPETSSTHAGVQPPSGMTAQGTWPECVQVVGSPVTISDNGTTKTSVITLKNVHSEPLTSANGQGWGAGNNMGHMMRFRFGFDTSDLRKILFDPNAAWTDRVGRVGELWPDETTTLTVMYTAAPGSSDLVSLYTFGDGCRSTQTFSFVR